VTLEKLSDIYRALGDYRRAFDVSQKSLRLCEEEHNRRGTVMALTELGIIYGVQNNQEQALSHLEKALAIAQEIGDTIMTATLRHDIAVQFQRLGNYERALGILQGLLKQTEDSGDRGGAAMVRNQIGQVHALRGAHDEALSYYNQSMAGLDAANMKRATVVVLNDVSEAYLAQGKNDEALSAAERAVSLSRETGRQLDLWLALTFMGYAQLALNRPLEARQSFAEAVSIIEKLRGQTAGGVEERQRYFEGGLRAHHGMLNVLVKENKPREALIFAERAKARVLLDVLQQGRVSVQKAMTAGELEQERRLKSELTQLNMQLGRATQLNNPDPTRVGDTQRRLEKTRLTYEAFQNSLYAAHPELKVQRGEAPIIDAEELATLLPDAGSALLEYVVTTDKTYLFVVTRAAAKEDVDVRVYPIPIKRDDLAKRTRAFRRQLAERDLGFRASAVKLYELLLKPAQAQLRGKTNIVIAPDDALWDLPFQALPTSVNRFLIEDAAIAYAPSLTVLREMTRRKREGADALPASLLAFGNPLLGKETINRAALTLRDVQIASLPEAEQEVKALRRLYGLSRSRVYIGADAREDRVKREAGQARILHFAAHGTLNNVSPMYSHLVLAKGGDSEDGLLEAWELMQLDLKADLAVLSACETARGRIGAGEGMVGLSWAMFIAGVPSTVVSQWKVEAASTRDLMVSFHRGLIGQPGAGKSKPTKAEALRQAALKLMRNPETRHPFYWAGFVLVGQGR
jgi:CHAT domain-containing protein